MSKKNKKRKNNVANNTPFHNGMTCTVDLLGRVSIRQGSRSTVVAEQKAEQK